MSKRRANEEHAAAVTSALRNESVREAALKKNWDDRENGLKAKEQEFLDAKKQLDGFDAKLKGEVAKAEAILTNGMKKQHDHEKALLAKDTESAKAVCEMRVQSLQTALEGRDEQLKDLKAQLVCARQDANNVASQALSASSDRKVAEALRQVVDSREQAQGGKQK